MRKPIPDRNPLDLFPPVIEPRLHRYFEAAQDHPFRPRATGVDLLNAWWLSEMALLAYAGPDFVERELRRAGLELAGPLLDVRGTQAFAALGEGFAVVAFRGTEVFLPWRDAPSLLAKIAEDYLTDIRIRLVPARQPARGRVHRGFRNALDAIWESLSELVARLRHEDRGRAIWMTGHSMGGALAILAAARLPDIQGVYAFGSPQVGDADFRAALPVRPVRFVHGSDVVTRVPVFALNLPPRLYRQGLLPRLEFLGSYRPVGDTVAFDRDGRLVAAADPEGALALLDAELRRLGISLKDWARTQPVGDLIDHAPIFYAVHLWNLYEESLVHAAA